MKWFLIGYVIFGAGGNSGIVHGYVAPQREVRIEMPSQEVCEQIKELNKYSTFECWAKRADTEKEPSAKTFQMWNSK